MTLFRRRPFVPMIRWITEARCLELARVLHLGARPHDLGRLLDDAIEGAATVTIAREGWPRG